MKKTFNKNKFVGNVAMKIALSRTNDPEFLADIVKTILNKYFKNVSKYDLLYAFEHNNPITELVNPNLNKIKEYAERFYIDTAKIKELIDLHINEFEIAWIYDWWKKDHKELYAAMVNNVKRAEMEEYITTQINLIVVDIKAKL